MAIVSAQPAVSPNGMAASSGLNPGLSLIAAAPNLERCAVPPRGNDPYQAGVRRDIARVVGRDKAAIGDGDIALMARLDQARACLKGSAPPESFKLLSIISAKGNFSNRAVNDAKKELILAAQNLAERQDSLRFLEKQAEQIPDFMRDRAASLAKTAIAHRRSPFQSLFNGAIEGLTKAQERYRAAQERVTSLTLELTNELQSQRR